MPSWAACRLSEVTSSKPQHLDAAIPSLEGSNIDANTSVGDGQRKERFVCIAGDIGTSFARIRIEAPSAIQRESPEHGGDNSLFGGLAISMGLA